MKNEHRFNFAERTQTAAGSIIREILKLLSVKDLISFAGGLPASELFPINELRSICDYVLKYEGSDALQYSISEGLPSLRNMLSARYNKKNIHVPVDQIIITNGAQQALDLIGKIFLNPGDKVVVGNPTYLGAVQAFNAYQAAYESIPLDDEGMMVDVLKARLKKNRPVPKLIYVVPDFQNPTGRTLPVDRRKMLVELSSQYGIPIVEDDPYSDLRFAGAHLPALQSIDSSGLVIHVGTFSKIVSPGLRIGWASAHPDIMEKLILAKQAGDLHCGTLVQSIVCRFIKLGFLDPHIKLIRSIYKTRRDVMVECLKTNFPEGSHWIDSEGGLFIWVVLPKKFNTAELLQKAISSKVAYVPGAPFFPNGGGENTLRLNFSNSTPKQITAGMQRLGKLFEKSD